MSTVIDRRQEDKGRYVTSRDRFLQRNKKRVREAVDKAIGNTDLDKIGEGGVDVTVPKDGMSQPTIHNGQGGVQERVLPGNKDFGQGDRLPKPQGGGGGGGGQGEPGDGDAEDDFTFHLDEEEFLDILFEDMELPNLIKEEGEDAEKTERQREGFQNEGTQNKVDLVESQKRRRMRHIATKAPIFKKQMALLAEQEAILTNYDPDFEGTLEKDPALDTMLLSKRVTYMEEKVEGLIEQFGSLLNETDAERMQEIDDELDILGARAKAVRPWNKIDLKYRRHEEYPKPISKAVMFCLMDVSASMDEEKKTNTKLFYWLLHKFLKRNYEQVDLVFIRHTTEADEVDEQTFFHDRKSGGTQISPAIELMKEIKDSRYDDDWNIYGAQSSDGENYQQDTLYCVDLLREMMPDLQGYFYTEVSSSQWGKHMSIMEDYETLENEFSEKFFQGEINTRADIFPLFREFFSKRETREASFKPSAAAAFGAQIHALEEPALP